MIRVLLKLAYTVNILIETVIVIKILLSLFAHNREHMFMEWINSTAEIFISPFNGIAPSALVIDKIEIALTPVIALLFYAIVGFVLSELIKTFRDE